MTRRVTFLFNAVSTFADYGGTQEEANSYANLIANRLRNAGWSVINCNAIAWLGFVQVTLNVNLDTVFDARSTLMSYLPSALSPDWYINQINYTDSGFTQTQTQTQTRTRTQNNNMSDVNPDMTLVGNTDGYPLYRYAIDDGYYIYTGEAFEFWGDTLPLSVARNNSANWLSNLGSQFGFDKTTGLGKLGIGAAAGGAAVIFLAIVLLSNKK